MIQLSQYQLAHSLTSYQLWEWYKNENGICPFINNIFDDLFFGNIFFGVTIQGNWSAYYQNPSFFVYALTGKGPYNDHEITLVFGEEYCNWLFSEFKMYDTLREIEEKSMLEGEVYNCGINLYDKHKEFLPSLQDVSAIVVHETEYVREVMRFIDLGLKHKVPVWYGFPDAPKEQEIEVYSCETVNAFRERIDPPRFLKRYPKN
ncbi:hypothetical protein CL618_03610 [archaeon]|nr:hypothetical protein [archaeon]